MSSTGVIIPVVVLAVTLLVIAGTWKTFTKANEPGWASLIPFYNFWVMVRISDNEWWWFLMIFVPVLNFVALFKVAIGIAKGFGKGIGFGIGIALLPPVFFPLLGFGSAQYN